MGIVAPVADRLVVLLRSTTGVEPPVRIRAWDGSEAGPAGGPVLVVRSRRALRRLLWRPGELGLARAYVTGDIDVEGDLKDGLRRVWRLARSHPGTGLPKRGRAVAVLQAARLGAVGLPPAAPASEARLSGRLHTRPRDQAVIAHHYDLSNDFYQLLLDDHMAYSSAYFTRQGQSLYDAQTAKLEMICRKLGLKPGMHLLDVGCGWGSLILHAAHRYGVRATRITLSAQPGDLTVASAAHRGLTDSIEVRLQDYRDFGKLPTSQAAFDAVASTETGEHGGGRSTRDGVVARTLRVIRAMPRVASADWSDPLLMSQSWPAACAPVGWWRS